jgi:hypothetical protein
LTTVKRAWDKEKFRFHFELIQLPTGKEFKATFVVDIRDGAGWPKQFKGAVVKKPTPAEAIAEALTRWKSYCDPTAAVAVAAAAADGGAAVDEQADDASAKDDPWGLS